MSLLATVHSWYTSTATRRPIFGKVRQPLENDIDQGKPLDGSQAQSNYASNSGSGPSQAPPSPIGSSFGNLSSPLSTTSATDRDVDENYRENGSISAVVVGPRYYCGGRLTRRQFICTHCAVFVLLLLVIMLPITYFVIVPTIIRAKVRGLPLDALNVSAMDVQRFTQDGLDFFIDAKLPAQFPLGMNARIVPHECQIQTETDRWNDDSALLSLRAPPLELNLNEPRMNFSGGVEILKPQNLRKLIEELSGNDGLRKRTVYMRMRADIGVFGITFYRNFEAEKPMEIPAIKNDLIQLWSSLPTWMKADQAKNRLEHAQNATSKSATFSILQGFPPISLHRIEMENSARGPIVNVDMTMANPAVATVKLPALEFWFAIEGERLAKIRVEGINMQAGESSMSLRTAIEIASDARDRLPKALYRFATKVIGDSLINLTDGNLEAFLANESPIATISGPMTIKGTKFTGDITPSLALRLPISQIMQKMGIGRLRDFLRPDELHQVLHNCAFNVTVTNSDMQMQVQAVLPPLVMLPTQNLDIPFSFAFETEFMGIQIDDMHLVSSKQELTVRSNLVMTPINTIEAANALSRLAEAVLLERNSANIKVSKMELKVPNTNFAWSHGLLEGLILNFPIPPLDLRSLIFAATNDGFNLPLRMKSFLLHQLTKASGFHTEVSADLLLPVLTQDNPWSTPNVSVNLGWAEARLSIDDGEFVTIALSDGVALRDGMLNSLKSDILLPTSAEAGKSLIPRIQSILDAVLYGSALPGQVIISGLQFGPDKDNVFKTFSKVRIPIALESLRPICRNIVGDAVQHIARQQQKLLVVQSAGLELGKRSKVKAQGLLKPPFPLDIQIGKIGFNLGLGDEVLLDASLEPLTIKPENNLINLDMSIDFINDDGIQDSLKHVIERVWNSVLFDGSIDISQSATVSKFTLSDEASSAQILQFAGLKVHVPINALIDLVPHALNFTDVSAIFPPSMHAFMAAAGPTFEGVNLRTADGQALDLKPAIKMNNPLAVSMSLPYASVDISLGNGFLCSVRVSNLTLFQGIQILEPQFHIIFAGSTVESSQSLANVIADAMESWAVDVPLGMSRLLFGTSEKEVVAPFAKVHVLMPLGNFSLEPVFGPVVTQLQSSLPTIEELLHGKNRLLEKVRAIGLRTLPGASLDVRAEIDILNPTPISASIGWLSTDILLDGQRLGRLVVSPLNLEKGYTNLKVGILAQSDPSGASAIAKLVNHFLSGDELNMAIGFRGLLLGQSENDFISALKPTNLSMPLSKVLKGRHPPIDVPGLVKEKLKVLIDGRMENGSGYHIPLTAGIALSMDNFQVAVKSGDVIDLSTQLRLDSDIVFDLDIGYISPGIRLNGAHLANVVILGVKLKQASPATVQLQLLLNDHDDIQTQIAALSGRVIRDDFTGSIQIDGVKVGTTAMDYFSWFSKLGIAIPLDAVLQPIIAKARGIAGSILNSEASRDNLFKFADRGLAVTLSPTLGISLHNLTIETAPDQTLKIGMKADVRSLIPFGLFIPYFSSNIGINGRALGAISVTGLALETGRAKGLSLTVSVAFSNDLEVALGLARLVDDILNSRPLQGTSIGVLGMRFGVSDADTIDTFAKMSIQLDAQIVDFFVGAAQKLVMGVVGGSAAKLISHGAKGWSIEISEQINAHLGSISIQTAPRGLVIDLDASITMPIDTTAILHYVTFALGLDDSHLATIEMSISVAKSLSKVHVFVQFGESLNRAGKVGSIVSAILNRVSIPGSISISNVGLGLSRDDTIETLHAIRMALPVESALRPIIRGLPTNWDPLEIARALGLQLGHMSVRALPNSRIACGIEIAFDSSMPMSVSIGFASVSVSIEGKTPILETSLRNLNASLRGQTSFKLDLELAIASSDAAQEDFHKFIQNPSTLGLSQVEFGDSPEDTIDVLSGVRVDVPVSVLMSDRYVDFALQQVGIPRSDLSLKFISKILSINKLDVEVGNSIRVDFGASLLLPISLEVDVPFATITVNLDKESLAAVHMQNIRIVHQGGRLMVNCQVVIEVSPSEQAEHEIARLANSIIAGDKDKEVRIIARIGDIFFGVSRDDQIVLASKIRIYFDLSGPLKEFLHAYLDRFDSIGIAQSIGLQIGHVRVKAAQPGVLVVNARIGMNITMPLNLRLPFIRCTARISGTDIVALEVHGLEFHARTVLQISIMMTFSSSVDAQGAVMKFISNPTKFQLLGLHLGASPVEAIQLLQKSQIDIPASLLVNETMLTWLIGQFGISRNDLSMISLQRKMKFTKLDVKVGSKINADTAISIDLPVSVSIDLSMPVAAVIVYLDGFPLTGVVVRDLHVASFGRQIYVAFKVELDMAASESAQERVANLVTRALTSETKLHATVGVGSIMFGSSTSETDMITLFSKVRIDINASDILGMIRETLPEKLDLVEFARVTGVKLGRIEVSAVPATSLYLETNLSLSGNLLPFNIEIGYSAFSVGIGQTEIVHLELGKLSLRANQRFEMTVGISLGFVNSDNAQSAVAKFIENPSNFFVTGVVVGASRERNMLLISKARIEVPASLFVNKEMKGYILQQVGLSTEALTLDSLAKKFDISVLDIQVAEETKVDLKGSISLPMDIRVDISYMSATFHLDNLPFAFAKLTGLNIAGENGHVQIATTLSLHLVDTAEARQKIASMMPKILANEGIPISLGTTSMTFGVAPEDQVQTLSKVQVVVDGTEILKSIRSVAEEYARRFAELLVVDRTSCVLHNGSTLRTELSVDISKLPFVNRVSLLLNFASVDLLASGKKILSVGVNNFTLRQGGLHVQTDVIFDGTPSAHSELAMILNDISRVIFKMPFTPRSLILGMRGVKFGSKADSAIEMLSLVELSVESKEYVRKAVAWYNKVSPFTIENIHATLVPEGVTTKVEISNRIPLPVYMSVALAFANLQMRNMGYLDFVDCFVRQLDVRPGVITFQLDLWPLYPNVIRALEDVAPRAFGWKNFAENVVIGNIGMYRSQSKENAAPEDSFTHFMQAKLDAPELTVWSPIQIRPILINPFTQGIGIDLELSFVNNGPLHVNVGNVDLSLVNERRATTIGTFSLSDVVLNNRNESGGKNVLYTKARLSVGFLSLPGVMVDLVAHRDAFKHKAKIRWREDQPLPFLEKIAEGLPDVMKSHLWDTIFAMMRNSSIRLFKAEGEVLEAKAKNATLSRRWMAKRNVDEIETKREIAKWTNNEPVISHDLQPFIKIDWSALKVVEE